MWKYRSFAVLAVAIVVCVAVMPVANAAEAAPAAESLPTTAKNFRLEDHNGGSHELYRMKDVKAVVLFYQGNGCPIVRKSVPEIKAIRDAYQSKGVAFFLINANPLDDKASIVAEAKEFEIDIPVLMDTAQLVTHDLGTKRTGEAIVIVGGSWKIAYRGAVDDRLDYGAERPKANNTWLRNALDAVLEGKDPEVASTETKGCLIDLKDPPKKISYSKHIAPLLAEKCASCHVEGHIGPFAMDSYENVAGRRSMIREVLMTKRMPPWHADPHHGEFTNDTSLTESEMRTMIAWLDAEAPRGEGKDPLLKFAVENPEQIWPLGKPDIIIPMAERVEVPADGVVDYVYQRVPYTGDEDLWIQAADVLPEDHTVLHHGLVFLRYPKHLRHLEPDNEAGLNGFFAGYVPGMLAEPYPKGAGKWVPKGSEFVFQMHYTTTGRASSDQSKLGLYLTKKKPGREFFTRAATSIDLEIPPNSKRTPAEAKYAFKRDVILYEMGPHMHFRGSEVNYVVKYPDGKLETLLNVPNYDFNWQTMYRFKEPKRLPAGTELLVTGAFDNSANNPRNPDPSKWVYFGEQSWEEMFVGYIGYTNATDEPEVKVVEERIINFGKPITAESILNTYWRIGRWRLNFLPDNVLTVGRSFKGTWTFNGDKLELRVAGDEFDLKIEGDTLVSEDGPLEYLPDGGQRPQGSGRQRVSMNE